MYTVPSTVLVILSSLSHPLRIFNSVCRCILCDQPSDLKGTGGGLKINTFCLDRRCMGLIIIFSLQYWFLILLAWSGQVTGYLAEAANVSHTKLNSHFTLRCWFVTFNAWGQTRDVWQMTPKIFSSGRQFVLFKTMQNPDNYLWWELKSKLNIGPYDKGHESAFLIILYW